MHKKLRQSQIRQTRKFSRCQITALVAGLASVGVASARAMVPAYNIYPYPATAGGTSNWSPSISTNGTYAAGQVQTSGPNAYGVLVNVSNMSATQFAQSGVIGVGTRGTQETYGAPFAVNNLGLMFGGSSTGGLGGQFTTGTPTVWQNGSAYNLPVPNGAGGGQIHGANDLNDAVGSVKLQSASADLAAFFEWHGVNNFNNNAYVLSQSTDPNNAAATNLNIAYAINNAGQVVGQANQVNLGHGYAPFFLNNYNDSTAQLIPPPVGYSTYNGGEAFALSSNGLAAGDYTCNQSQGVGFVYNSANNVTTPIPYLAGTSNNMNVKGVNSTGEVVGHGGGAYSVPFLFDGTNTYDLQNLLSNNPSAAWHLDDNTSAAANSIADNGDIVGVGNLNGSLTSFIMIPTGSVTTGPQTLTFNNAGGAGDGLTWDTTQQNFNNGSGVTTFSSANTDVVTFNDVNNGHYSVLIPSIVTPGSTRFENSSGSYVVSGAGGIAGNGAFFKNGSSSVTLNTINTYAGPTIIYGGSVVLGVNGALPSGSTLEILGAGSSVVLSPVATPYLLQVGTLYISSGGTLNLSNNSLVVHGGTVSGTSGITGSGGLTKVGTGGLSLNAPDSYTGATTISGGGIYLGVAGALPQGTNLTINGSGASLVANSVGTAYAVQVGTLSISAGRLDLQSNDLIVHMGSLSAVTALVKTGYNGGAWNGATGIISSSADSLTSLGVILNDNGAGTPFFGADGSVANTFGGGAPVDGDVLVKYTYYGDTNLDGKVDGSDYSRIDAGFLLDRAYSTANPAGTAYPATGWYNGDLNYDGTVNGSDYTLIDNAFNRQGTAIATEVAASTAQLAGTSSVPEPTAFAFLGLGAVGMLSRRRSPV